MARVTRCVIRSDAAELDLPSKAQLLLTETVLPTPCKSGTMAVERSITQIGRRIRTLMTEAQLHDFSGARQTALGPDVAREEQLELQGQAWGSLLIL